ncbi:hypothetical protein BGX21_011289 [Mortierella sp. AD011]|nr:hypothetical protein BGX20_011023 [Mortierella sp. AD010]KAF9391236.1 hypothetical protein BGX21_011289 [Mortierella sp. AD011]
MASGMDKGLMALMGIEDDIPKDEGLAPVNTAGNMSPLQSSQDMPSFFDDEESAFLSDQDVDIEMKSYSISRSAKNTPSSQRTADFAGAAVSPQAHTNAVTSTPRASTSSLFASPVSSSQEGSLFPPNFTPPDETPPRDIRALLKLVTSSPPFFSSDSNPFGRPSPGKVRISRSSSSSSPSPSLFSPEFNPFARPPSDKIRVKKKSSSQGGDGSSMFSPTLSPRKTKKKHSPSSGSSSHPHVNTSTPSNATSVLKTNRTSKSLRASPSPTSAKTEARAAEGLSSPISSFSLSRRAAAMFSDSDSDISPIEDNISSSKSVQHDIVLNMSMSSDIDTEMLSLNKSPSFTDSRNSLPQDQGDHEKRGQSHNTEWDEDEVMLVDTQAKQSVKAQKEMLKVHMEANKLMRGSSFPIKPRVSKTYNLSELMKQSQSKLDEKKNTARVPYLYTGNIQPSIPERQKHSLNSNQPKPKIKTVALSDDSEDEPDVGRVEFSQSRLDAAKAFLIAPKQRRPGPAKLGIQPISMSSQGESSIPMSPLSKNVSKMSISGGYGGPASSHQPSNDLRQSFITSPSKSQRPGAGINLLKEEIRRKQAKSNMELRKKLATEAKKSGKWMAPEEHAAEQMLLEEDADDEGDEDYDPKETGGKNAQDNDGDMDEEEDGDYEENEELAIERGSADEAGALSGESEGENKRIGGDNADDVADSESNIEGESDGDDDDDEEDEEEEAEQEAEAIKVKARRLNSKKAIIEDEDELNVVIVNRENPPTESEDDDEDQSSDENRDEASSDSGDDDDDADAHESQDIDGSPGFGNFFAPSMDQSVTKKQNVADDPTPTIESSVTSMPSSDPSPNQSEDFSQSQSLVIPSGILSAKFTPSVPDSSNPFSINTSIAKEIADTESPNVDDSQSLAPRDLSQPRNAFDVLIGAQGLRRLRKKEASLKESIPKGAKSAFIEYEAEEEDDEHKGMGGIDYESDNDQDDYDLGDGMIDTTAALDSQDAEDVRKLHMKHEQEQHDKDISDLVHGIAAGNLWKRRNGQGDDLDIFDEEDMDGRFQRKKKLKVTEKFEKLADNPSTAAFARALKKEIDDDHIVFLSDPDESNDEADAGSKGKKVDNSDNEDEEMAAAEPSDDEISVDKSLSNPGYLEDEDEEEDEPLNTDKRKENLRLARLRNNSETSKSGSTVTAWTKTQSLPFGPSSSEHTFMKTGNITSTTLVETEDSAKDEDEDSIEDHIDEYNNLLKRSKFIRDIVDGVIDPAGPSVELIATSSSSSFSHRSTELIDELDSTTSFLRTREEVSISAVDPALRTFAKPRMLARQSSSFLEEERRGLFLSTVGEEGAGSVKDVNRRKMAFGAATAPSESTGSASSRQRN